MNHLSEEYADALINNKIPGINLLRGFRSFSHAFVITDTLTQEKYKKLQKIQDLLLAINEEDGLPDGVVFQIFGPTDWNSLEKLPVHCLYRHEGSPPDDLEQAFYNYTLDAKYNIYVKDLEIFWKTSYEDIVRLVMHKIEMIHEDELVLSDGICIYNVRKVIRDPKLIERKVRESLKLSPEDDIETRLKNAVTIKN